ncbi:MAG: DUF5668 domain-containing protein [Patescibacteria group bacterium]
MFFALAIIVIGVILLLENIGIITGNIWEWVWPALIIILGLSMLLRRKRRSQIRQQFNRQSTPRVEQVPDEKVEEGEFEEK